MSLESALSCVLIICSSYVVCLCACVRSFGVCAAVNEDT